MADNNKISFIVYQQREMDLSICYESLRQIRCPKGYQAEVVTIDSCESRGEAYQYGMESSDAKYKIYMDDRTWVLYDNLLTEIIEIFLSNPEIGIMGIAGTEIVPTNGLFWTSPKRIGKWSEQEGKVHIVGDFAEPFRKVQVLDGCFLVTQYDFPWRRDLFGDDRFLCAAQAIEYQRKGYEACVIHQDFPWLVSQSQVNNYDTDAREQFLDEYSKDIFPLVSVVIPTYCRPEYLKIALDSVLAQTYRNLDIFITDNSPDNRTENLMKDYLAKDVRIRYEHHPECGRFENWDMARQYNNPKAEYVNWLMDDDVFLPEKISTMLDYYLFNPEITLVTSYRQLIDENGNVLPDSQATMPIASETTKISGQYMGKEILCKTVNWIGEPTTVLIKKRLMKNGDLGWTGTEGKYLLSDVPTWLNLLEQGDMIYIREPLSQFRQHSGQEQDSLSAMIWIQVCWALEIRYAWERKVFLETERELRLAILTWMKVALNTLLFEFETEPQLDTNARENLSMLERIMTVMLGALSNGYVLDYTNLPDWNQASN